VVSTTPLPPWWIASESPITGAAQASAIIAPDVQRALLQAGSDERVRVLVHLREQATGDEFTSTTAEKVQHRARVVSTLKATAQRTQANLITYLESAQSAGQVASYTPFWIFNGIAVQAQPAIIQELAHRPEIASIQLDHYRQWLPNTSAISNPATSILQTPTATEWGVERVRADQVWASLHISGTGAVVAGMDTGVDWLHPALRERYRGYAPHGPSNHVYHWYDATGGALYPVDGHGHGTHTMGTIVGQDGTGVAPGARWIAVKVLNNQGQGYDSWIHAGFQWLLAPGGDPAQAPDVVNNSWGNDIGSLTTFQDDLRALRAAGIFAVFSSGNRGPNRGTVGSPASLPEAFAVGATDVDDEVTNFSSRGPSPWREIRPHVAAPGVNVRSSLPGGAYGTKNGTSMAAPHVAGIAALLKSVSPTLSITHTAYLITSTAVPSGDPIPNNDTGWGRVDAFAAVAALAHTGFISGQVSRADDGAPIAGATVQAGAHGPQGRGQAQTGEDGRYLLALAPAPYDVSVSAFGYAPETKMGISVVTGATSLQNFSLLPYPSGTVEGQISDAQTGAPVTATIDVLDAPLQTSGAAYRFDLPAGDYVIRACSVGYRIVTATVTVDVGQTTHADLALVPAPAILLVDSGAWYYDSQIHYFRQALDALHYAYDEWAIKRLPDDVPSASDLASYDLVIWSAPQDAPGFVGAGQAVGDYLVQGGLLFLSGQDVGYWDGGGVLGYWSAYYGERLKARYVQDNAPTHALQGLGDQIFAGLALTIAGPGGADNQTYPDVVDVRDADGANAALRYDEGGYGGIQTGTCLPYRAVYLSFGFEAIDNQATRREVMKRAIDWLTSSPPAVGLEWSPIQQMQVGPPGATISHTLRLRHLGQAGVTDTVSLELDVAQWPSELSHTTVTLAPCASQTVVVTVTIPPTTGWHEQDTAVVVARSSLSPTLVQTATLVSKAPAPILLVDDDRWYDQEDKYEAALNENRFPYDYWRTGWSGSEPGWGSPTPDLLARYPIVVWYTGYDWFRPVTDEEIDALKMYLDQGGRLFLSSQDFLYYHHQKPFTPNYLGVLSYTESVTPTMASGTPESPLGDRLGPYVLHYPFKNWSDGILPALDATVSFRDQNRTPIGLARAEADYKTVFFSYPFEAIPPAGRRQVMDRAVGWLSWLGESTFTAHQRSVAPGARLTYTLTLRNDGPEAVRASLSNTLPISLTLVPGSLTGPATYDAPSRHVSLLGTAANPLQPGATLTVTYQATVSPDCASGETIVNVARIGLEDHRIRFDRDAVLAVDAPDLSPSYLACHPLAPRPGATITCGLHLANAGPAGALTATVFNLLPQNTRLILDSVELERAGTAKLPTRTLVLYTQSIQWAGPLPAGDVVTLSYQLTLPRTVIHPPFYNVAFLEDGVTGAWERTAWIIADPFRCYLPLTFKDWAQTGAGNVR